MTGLNDRVHEGQRRFRVALGLFGCLWAVVVVRLIDVQALGHERYSEQARLQHQRQIQLSARRGPILDRQGRELALDVRSVSFYCRPQLVEDPEAVAAHFAKFRGTSIASVRELMDKRRPFAYLLRQADEAQLAAIRDHEFAGVFEQEEVRRLYPYEHLAAQMIGFTGIDNDGREGLELALDYRLAESTGVALTSVDSRGNQLADRRLARQPARNGASVQLTIDVVMQGILEEELVRAVGKTGAEGAMGIIADPHTGDLLALASVPVFDANVPGDSPAAHRRNRTITDPFEPGSTFKPITLAAVLEEGRTRAATQVFCEQGAYVLATGDTLRDTSPHGWLTTSEVLALSSNIGMIKLAGELSRADYYDYLRRFGFGTRTGVSLPAESSGLLRHATEWSDRSLATIAIGQEVSVTALQLVQAFGVIANGGTLMSPRVVTEVRQGSERRVTETQKVRRVISENTATRLQRMLAGVVTDGTGKAAAISGVEVAGKTGTAQRALRDGAGYAEDEYVSSFVGFVPATSARYLCLIVIENPRIGKYGGVVAAPAFRRTMERVLKLDGSLEHSGEVAQLSPNAGAVPMPDLRGLVMSQARHHASRRGLGIRFEGAGSLVVAQQPAARSLQETGAIVCWLGEADEIAGPDLRQAPRRQSVLLQKLSRERRLAALGR
jgi:cell division protein FtsI (penicillin-binding protein 3)